MTALLLPLGLIAGALTTVAGLGGGMLLLLALSLVVSPAEALAATAPALLLGNLHRVLMFRGQVDRRIGGAFIAGAFPGSLLGGLFVAAIPATWLRWPMLVMTGFAVLRASTGWSWRPPTASIVPAGFGIGAATATSGGAGLLAGPLFMAAGLSGESYIATCALGATAMHIGRLTSYGIGGLMTRAVLEYAAVLTLSVLAGNLVGQRARKYLTKRTSLQVELGALIACVTLAAFGVTK